MGCGLKVGGGSEDNSEILKSNKYPFVIVSFFNLYHSLG